MVAVAVQPAWRRHTTLGDQHGSASKLSHLVPLRDLVCKQTRPSLWVRSTWTTLRETVRLTMHNTRLDTTSNRPAIHLIVTADGACFTSIVFAGGGWMSPESAGFTIGISGNGSRSGGSARNGSGPK